MDTRENEKKMQRWTQPCAARDDAGDISESENLLLRRYLEDVEQEVERTNNDSSVPGWSCTAVFPHERS